MFHVLRPGWEASAIDLKHVFDVFLPIHSLWWQVIGESLAWVLTSTYHAVTSVPLLAAIGGYGLSIIVMTIALKIVLAPLYHFQLSVSRKTALEQRKLAPELAELRKKHKGDQAKQQAAMMELYKEHGINPLSGMVGCLPALIQIPILSALYYVFLSHGKSFADHFLFIPHLNATPSHFPLLAGLPIPQLPYLVLPVMAGMTTFVQSRMMQQPPNPAATEQEQQAQQMTKTMAFMMPLMIAYFAIITPAGLGLYWFISNCFAIVQQYLVAGWGGLFGYPEAAPAAPLARRIPNTPRPGSGASAAARPTSGPAKPRRARR